ncbi:chromosome partitioning protein [Duganella sp. SG902]|uniref:ParA family protein n=1 Tax=Duganella sp. SG902 TaxID=2587016 RepID=UPI00159E54FA|nr:ParA family protein [Duganella sp. SG902]NVM77469.1 chromosome partitioning protein [Duganella sp. SG902]
MVVLAVANQKGGVGKTFVVCQLGFYLAARPLPTLVLELDHQMNATRSLRRGGRAVLAGFTTLDVLEGRAGALPEGELVLVPANPGLAALERQPRRHNDYVNALQAFLTGVGPRFAACLIDTHPSPDVRYAAALAVADYLLSPVQLNQEAIDGIAALLQHERYGYHKLRQLLNPKLELIGILPNLVEPTPFQRANLRQLVLHHPGLLIPARRAGVSGYAYIPTRTAVAEAQAAGVPLWQLRQAVPPALAGQVAPEAMPLRSAARDAWREIQPSFAAIAARMGLGAAP